MGSERITNQRLGATHHLGTVTRQETRMTQKLGAGQGAPLDA